LRTAGQNITLQSNQVNGNLTAGVAGESRRGGHLLHRGTSW
jgi:hypothetical protein